MRPDGTPGGHWWWTPLRVVLAVMTLAFSLSLVHESPCIGTGWNNSEVRYSKACYSDVPYLYTSNGFANQQWPYSPNDAFHRMEYGVGTSYVAWVVSHITALAPAGPSESARNGVAPDALWGLPGMTDEATEYFVITAIVLFGCALAAAFFVTRSSERRPWDALMFAASPVLVMTALIGWDLLAVMAVAGALWAWGRRRAVWLGVFIGLGAAFAVYPALILLAVGALAVRDRSLRRDAGVTAAAAAVTWILLQIPAWLGSFDAWNSFWSVTAQRGADWGSLWLVAEHLGAHYSAHAMNVIQWTAMAVVVVAVAALAKWAPNKPSLAQLGFLLTVGFLITNKVYAPQYVLWLLPLAVLARPRWRDQMIWQAGELFYVFMIWWSLGGYLKVNIGSSFGVYSLGIFVRVAAELYLVVMILRDLLLNQAASDEGSVEPHRAEERVLNEAYQH